VGLSRRSKETSTPKCTYKRRDVNIRLLHNVWSGKWVPAQQPVEFDQALELQGILGAEK
jgi:hypothetical protein